MEAATSPRPLAPSLDLPGANSAGRRTDGSGYVPGKVAEFEALVQKAEASPAQPSSRVKLRLREPAGFDQAVIPDGLLFDAVLHGFLFEPEKALKIAQDKLDNAKVAGNPRAEAAALLAIADANASQEEVTALAPEQDPLSAQRLAADVLSQLQASGDTEGQAAALHVMAKARLAFGDCKGALQAAEESLRLFKSIGHQTGEGATLNVLAQAQLGEDPEAALLAAARGRDIFRKLGDSRRAAALERTLIGARLGRGDVAGALHAAEASLVSCRRDAGDRRDEAAALVVLAEVRSARHEHDQAVLIAVEAAEVFTACGDRRNEAAALHHAANACLKLERPEEALRHSGRAQAIFRELGDRSKEVLARSSGVKARLALGQVEDALTLASDMAEACRRAGDSLSLAEALRQLTSVHLVREASAEAREAAQEARNASSRLFGRRRLEGKADSLDLLVEACQQEGDMQAAMQAAQELVECCREAGWSLREARALRTLARGQLSLRKPLRAIEASGRAMTLFKECGDDNSADEMKFLFARGQELRSAMREAARNARQAWLLFRERGDSSLLFEAAKACHDAHHMFDDKNVTLLGDLDGQAT